MECDDRGSWCLTLPLAAHLALARPRLTLLASRYMASADSGTLLKELLQQASALPPPSEGAAAVGDNGISTWAALMRGIGREADMLKSEGTLEDRMLAEWVRPPTRCSARPPRSRCRSFNRIAPPMPC